MNKNTSDDEITGHRIRKKQKTDPQISMETINLSNTNVNPIPKPIIQQIKLETPINFQIKERNATCFYEQKKEISKTERTSYLATSDLRKFHNWIKSVIIKSYSEQVKNLLKQKKCDGRISVLELGCGQGGDLQKWAHSNIGSFIGVDIAKEYLEKIKGRYSELCKDSRFRNLFEAQFIVQSGASDEAIFFADIHEKLYFDIISCQFSLHYMFDTKQNALNLLNNISKKLVNQGYVIMTIPDANVIVKRFRNLGKKNANGDILIGNKYYSMKIDDLSFPSDKLYGLKYGFYLEDAVGEKTQISDEDPFITYVSEYLIEFQNFIKIAKDFNLELVEQNNFLDFYKENRMKFKELFRILRLSYGDNEHMDPQLWEISHLYKVVVFQKKNGLAIENIDRNFKKINHNYYKIEAEEKFK